MFGTPPYGGAIAQNVYYADSDLCDPTIDTTGGYPTRPNNEPWPTPYILMVDRGSCTFVKKVRNAQRAGAAGVIIADNTCLCEDAECVSRSGTGQCETSEPIMADDGSGADVSIPSFLMFKNDADKIKQELKEKNNPVQIEMAWSLPNPDGRVEYDLWTVPTDNLGKSFLKSWKPMAMALGKDAYFTPHQYIYDGLRTHCVGEDGENFCYNLCTNHGRYCATDPDNDLDKGISGADVVKEELRRLCIWNKYGEDGIGEQFWDYLDFFYSKCDNQDFFMSEDCARDAMKHSGVDANIIQMCMDDSGGLEENKSNSRLDAEIAAQNARGIVILPSAFVNTAAIRGQLSSNSMFHAICAGFAEGSEPEICMQCGKCSDAVSCVLTKGVCSGSSIPSGVPKGSVSTHTFAFWMFFVVAAFGGVGYWHYNKTREDMREQVRGILAEYMPLEDQDAGGAMDFASKGGTVPLFS